MAIIRNGAEEFFETIIMMSAQNYVQKYISSYVSDHFPDIKEPVLDKDGNPIKDAAGNVITVSKPNIIGEAVAGAANVVLMGAIMYVIRYEEQFLERLFIAVNSAIAFIVFGGKQFYDKIKNKIKGRRGFKATKLYEVVVDNPSDRTSIATLVANRADAIIMGRGVQYQSGSVYGTSLTAIDSAQNREVFNHQVGNSMVQAQMQVLMFKLFSKNFTASDQKLIKTVMRNANVEPSNMITAEDLNKVADFMFVKDVNGNISGLSELFLELAMGMNLHNKVDKNV